MSNELLRDLLLAMARRGESVSLNYGEDIDCWECSWIVKGERFTGVSGSIEMAVERAEKAAWTKLRSW